MGESPAKTQEHFIVSKRAHPKPSLWWTTLVRGLCLTVIGLVMFLWPARSLTLLLQLLGVYWLIGGVFDLVEGVVGRGPRTRPWMLLSAVVSVAAGALVLSQPLLTGFLAGRFVILLIGAAALAAGAIRLVQGRDGTRTWRSVLIGTTYVVLGVIVVAHPFTTQALIMLLLSAWAVAAGVLGVFAALSLRGAQKQVGSA